MIEVEKVKKEAYEDAKDNMTTKGLQTAIEQAQRATDVAKETYEYRKAVLDGYKQALKARG